MRHSGGACCGAGISAPTVPVVLRLKQAMGFRKVPVAVLAAYAGQVRPAVQS